MGDSFEARLGPPGWALQEEKSDRSSSTVDGVEEVASEVAPNSVVLVVIDVNKELNMNALNWALGHVIQTGDTVRLLGILQHINNPSTSHFPFWFTICSCEVFL